MFVWQLVNDQFKQCNFILGAGTIIICERNLKSSFPENETVFSWATASVYVCNMYSHWSSVFSHLELDSSEIQILPQNVWLKSLVIVNSPLNFIMMSNWFLKCFFSECMLILPEIICLTFFYSVFIHVQ